VLARGLIGDKNGEPVVACPMHKRNFSLNTGACVGGEAEYCVRIFEVRVDMGSVFILIDDSGPVR
ncbi:MAG: nitrite reductase (NAD(P)H) small subunit, partial [Spirochaetia bacterium]|nr:nitrite reductase (NAD(P)H) small subunit [Spirochaetia bacterium]